MRELGQRRRRGARRDGLVEQRGEGREDAGV